MRPRPPELTGSVSRNGTTVGYDVFGDHNTPSVVLTPAWAIAQSRLWKAQVPVLARRYRVITVEGRGNGRADRPIDPAAYTFAEHAGDVLAVLDATGTERAVVAGVSRGGVLTALLAATAPERVTGAILIAPALKSLAPAFPEQLVHSFTREPDADEGWALYNQHVWRRDLPRFADFFWHEVFPEPHSTKQIEDGVGWTLETDGDVLAATQYNEEPVFGDRERTLELLRGIRPPVLVIHGTDDRITPVTRGQFAAEATGGDLLLIEGGGHCPQARDPIRVNRAMIEFIERVTPPEDRRPEGRTWTRALNRPKKVLYLSSPIGLGHARRDLAIARALRAHRPGVQVHWLAQDPVTRFLSGSGEDVHPASRDLASESAHIVDEAHEHTLHAFQAIRTELRRRLGYPLDDPVVVVTVGGSGVGETLLRTVLDAFPRARKEVDGLRMLVVCGPRIDARDLPRHDGVDLRGYVDDLPAHLLACDAAVVQGGLTTTMELVACRRPFVYVPLAEHFEQQRHVRHRLDRYRAGRCLDPASLDPEVVADALADQLRTPVDYLPVATDGAERAAAVLADLL
jgi:pimeloyl-ACP methyl ester carboxylesterase/predicted glycosyltransferase